MQSARVASLQKEALQLCTSSLLPYNRCAPVMESLTAGGLGNDMIFASVDTVQFIFDSTGR
jgi:hypothetical protein